MHAKLMYQRCEITGEQVGECPCRDCETARRMHDQVVKYLLDLEDKSTWARLCRRVRQWMSRSS